MTASPDRGGPGVSGSANPSGTGGSNTLNHGHEPQCLEEGEGVYQMPDGTTIPGRSGPWNRRIPLAGG